MARGTRKALLADDSGDDQSSQKEITITHKSSTIRCVRRPTTVPTGSRIMIFTHGAGGTISTPAVANFADGFSIACHKQSHSGHASPMAVAAIDCFQGNMNLKSRTSMFGSVVEHAQTSSSAKETPLRPEIFGGRSMGARAAVIAANTANLESDKASSVNALVLVSYPLLGQNNEVRDQILLDIDKKVRVLFIIGSKDHMCDLDQLDSARRKMSARSWLVTVEGAGHGMDLKPKEKMQQMQSATGRIAAEWCMEMSVCSTRGDVGGLEDCKIEMELPLDKDKKEEISVSTKPPSSTTSTKKRKIEKEEASVEPAPTKRKRKQRGK